MSNPTGEIGRYLKYLHRLPPKRHSFSDCPEVVRASSLNAAKSSNCVRYGAPDITKAIFDKNVAFFFTENPFQSLPLTGARIHSNRGPLFNADRQFRSVPFAVPIGTLDSHGTFVWQSPQPVSMTP